MTHRRFDGAFVPDALLHVPEKDMRAVMRGRVLALARYGLTSDELLGIYRRDFREHLHERPCPAYCGCIEWYDDRAPDVPDGGYGPVGCPCGRCQGREDEPAGDGLG